MKKLLITLMLFTGICMELHSQETVLLFPETVNLYEVSQVEPTVYVGLSTTYDGLTFHINVAKMNNDEEIIWSTELTPNIFYAFRKLFVLDDGNLLAINGNYVYLLNPEGTIIADYQYECADLDYTPIPGDVEYVYFLDAIQNDEGVLLFGTGYALTPDFYRILSLTQLNNAGEITYSKAYVFPEDYYAFKIATIGDKVHALATNYDIDENLIIIIDNILGEVVDEVIIPGDFFMPNILNVHDGIIQFGTSYPLLTAVDNINKISPSGESIFSKTFINPASDSIESLVAMTELASHTLVSLNKTAVVPFEEYVYRVRYYNADGDTVYQSPAILNCDQFTVYQFQAVENNLLFSGTFNDLVGTSMGFVLLTDSTGAFNRIIVNGTVYFDENGNGIMDLDESPAANRLLNSSPYTYTNSSDSSGMYAHHFYAYGEYTFGAELPEYWDVVTPENYVIVHDEITTGSVYNDYNFGLTYSTPVTELVTSINILNSIRPGNFAYFVLSINNLGNQTIPAGELTFTFPESTTYSSGTAYESLIDNTLLFNYEELEPFDNKLYYIYLSASEDLELGDILEFTANSGSLPDDILPENNVDTLEATVITSYDPNHKTVDPAGNGVEGFIPMSTEYLEYTITFQNIGTASAINVKIIDTLDATINPKSIQILGAKHDYHFEITNGNIVTWYFNNINLPDSTTDAEGSIGFISYRVKLIADLPEGTVIENTAGIYFDYNDPIITNTTVNTLSDIKNAISDLVVEQTIAVFPNPAVTQFNIQGNTVFDAVIIKNINNQTVLHFTGFGETKSFTVNTGDLPAGLYTVTLLHQQQKCGIAPISIFR